jgi:hypothetical protein
MHREKMQFIILRCPDLGGGLVNGIIQYIYECIVPIINIFASLVLDSTVVLGLNLSADTSYSSEYHRGGRYHRRVLSRGWFPLLPQLDI